MRLRYFVPFVLAAMPSLVGAQTATPEPAASASPSAAATPSLGSLMSTGFAAISAAVRAQREARAGMLAALTPEHRTLLGELVGKLATAEAPDPDAAAQSLDAVLNPDELASITRISSAERQQVAAQFTASASASSVTPAQSQKLLEDLRRSQSPEVQTRLAAAMQKEMKTYQDPGYILLRTVVTGSMPTPGFSK